MALAGYEAGILVAAAVIAHDFSDGLNTVTILLRNRASAGLSYRWLLVDATTPRDQFHIHYGSRILSKRLREAGISHVCEEFDDNHSDIDYRMDVSLPFLYRAQKP